MTDTTPLFAAFKFANFKYFLFKNKSIIDRTFDTGTNKLFFKNKIFLSLAIDSFFLTCQVDMLVYDYCYLICVLRLDYDLSLFNDFQID